jgi:CHAD domain-containing protein
MAQLMTGISAESRLSTDVVSLLLESLDQRWQKYLSELSRCRRKCSEKSVHDLRVATRRMLAVIDVITTVMPDDSVNDIVRTLRKHLKSFGPLRDVQVQLVKVEQLKQSFPGLNSFFTVLLLRERRLITASGRELKRISPRPMARVITRWKERFASVFETRSMQRIATSAVMGAAAATFARAVALRQALDREDSSSIHRLRVAFKKFRYTVEVLQPVLPFASGALLKSMNGYQDRMGYIQDNEVLNGAVRSYLKTRPRAVRAALLPLREALAEEHRRLVAEFIKSADGLDTFWNEQMDSVQELPAA